MGDIKATELSRFILTLLEKEGFEKFPKMLIVGEKRLEDTDIEPIIKGDLIENKIFYLSAEEGLDVIAFKKACIHLSKSVYLFSSLKIDEHSETNN